MRNAGAVVLVMLITASISVRTQNASTIDPSQVTFSVFTCKGGDYNQRMAYGVVANGVDIADNATAELVLRMGVTFLQEKCPRPDPFGPLSIRLVRGDPSLTAAHESDYAKGLIDGYSEDRVTADNYADKNNKYSLKWVFFENFATGVRDRRVAQEVQQKAVQAQRASQRQAEQSKQSAIAERSAAFVKANGVKQFVSAERLAANPFAYQGQVVAIYGVFEQMTSSSQGTFSAPGVKAFQVSGIPTGRFVTPRTMVVLAGRVIGNVEIKLPVLGPTLVPNLSFVGSAFCQQQDCRDYAISMK